MRLIIVREPLDRVELLVPAHPSIGGSHPPAESYLGKSRWVR
jgi:hypothetical protein